MKRFFVTGLCMLLAVIMLAGCSCVRSGIEDPTETTEEVTEAVTDVGEVLLPIDEGLDMLYASGAGAWGTNIYLNADGSFTGNYHDSEMGLSGEGYDMTVIESDFRGSFKDIEKINDYAYSMKLDKLETRVPAGEEDFEDWDGTTVRILYEDAFGIAGGEEFILYLPKAPIDELDEEFTSWNPAEGDEDGLLGRYGLYNVNEGAAFFTFD